MFLAEVLCYEGRETQSLKHVNEICTKFIVSGAEYEINISAELRDSLTHVETADKDLFCQAKKEITNLVLVNLIPRYLDSEDYRKFVGFFSGKRRDSKSKDFY